MLRPEVVLARKLRREMSYPEVLLWQRLRGQSTGLKFRKQHPIGPYVVDFCCVASKLVIEVDSESHATRGQADAVRESFLRDNHFHVIRINAADILRDADAVAASIATLAAHPLHQPLAGSPPRLGEDQE